MRWILVLAMVVMAAGCARDPAPAAVPTGSLTAVPATSTRADPRAADVYVPVLRRYLDSPAENSFGDRFTTVYILDRTSTGDPTAPADRQRVASEVPAATFIADRTSVVPTAGGCAHVRDGDILITLGPIAGDGTKVRIAVNGFVACLGATWLTYVLWKQSGRWQVTGPTGPSGIA